MYRKYHSILDTHPDLICRYTPDFKLSFVNRAFAEFFGAKAESFTGQNILDIVQDSERDNIKRALKELSPDTPRVKISSLRTSAEGRDIHLEWTIIALYDASGEMLEYQSLGRDVTEEIELRKALEVRNSDLEASQSEIRIVLDSMPCKIWYKDENNLILKLNAKAANSMGMDIESIEGQDTYDLFGESAEAYHMDDLKVINTGEPLLGIVERYTPNDREPGWVQTDKIPFNHPITGKKRILVVATDITELKEQEALLKSINTNLEDFASLTSHDLQAPLRHVGIFAEMLEAEYNDKIDETGKSYISKIRGGVDNMNVLIKGFLKFMQSSPANIKLDLVNLSDVIDEAAERHREDLEACDGTITLPKDNIYIRGDAPLLNQVIGNLIENAIKYRDHKVPVQIDISAEKLNGKWRIRVADNGVGIEKKFAPNVFDLFGRARSHSNRKGSGIGLALCKRILTLHGGDIVLQPDRAKGSEFEITLNSARSQA